MYDNKYYVGFVYAMFTLYFVASYSVRKVRTYSFTENKSIPMVLKVTSHIVARPITYHWVLINRFIKLIKRMRSNEWDQIL